MKTGMTTAAWECGFRNALICGAGSVVILGVLTVIVSAISQQIFRNSAAIAFGIFWTVIFGVFLLGWLHGKLNSRSVLLDCGPHPTRNLFLMNAFLFVFLGISGGFGFFGKEIDIWGIASSLFALSFAVYWLIIATGRLQFREDGIWAYWSLLKWQKINNYEWKGQSDPTLLLQAKTKFPFFGRGALVVPVEHKDSVAELMRKYCA